MHCYIHASYVLLPWQIFHLLITRLVTVFILSRLAREAVQGIWYLSIIIWRAVPADDNTRCKDLGKVSSDWSSRESWKRLLWCLSSKDNKHLDSYHLQYNNSGVYFKIIGSNILLDNKNSIDVNYCYFFHIQS